MDKKILFLDFDGVLFDTLREVFIVNRNLFLGVDFLAEIDEKKYSLFSKYKYLVYNIWMFYYYNPIIFSDIAEDKIEAEFFNAIKNRDIFKEEEFCNKFLEARRRLVLNHREFWQNLEKPYKFFFKIKEFYEENKIKMIVASKKNKNSILERFLTYGLNFNPDLVFAREALDKYNSKGEFIFEFMEKFGYEKAIFVDDNLNNLNSTLDNKKVKNILALWGNTQPGVKGYDEDEAISEIENFIKE